MNNPDALFAYVTCLNLFLIIIIFIVAKVAEDKWKGRKK